MDPEGEDGIFLKSNGDLFEDELGESEAEGTEEVWGNPEADEYTPETYDNYLMVKCLLPRGGEQHKGTVKSRAKDCNGNPIGTRNENPVLDTRQYEVEFLDGSTETYDANVIAENIYSQVDDEGNQMLMLKEIIGHRKGHDSPQNVDTFYTYKGEIKGL